MTMFGSQWLANAGSTYEIEQSIRFNDDDSAYMHRTPSSAGNQKTNTISFWIKRTNLGLGNSLALFSAASSTYGLTWYIDASETDFSREQLTLSTGFANLWSASNHKLRDPGSWYHIVFAMDTTQGTTADRMKVYINGDGPITATTSNLALNTDYAFFDDVVNRIGSWTPSGGAAGRYMEGYMAEIHLIDGAQKAASDFGKYNSTTGQWVPIEYAGAYGDQGAYLKGQDSSALGDDTSGNGNDFTSSGLAANDQMSDSPTNNWCIMNSLAYDSTQITLTDGNLTLAWNTPNGNGGTTALSTFDLSQHGKSYWEFSAANSSVNYSVGICTNTSVWRKPRTQSAFAELRYGVANASTGEMQVTSGDGSIDSTGVLATTGSEVGMMAFDPASGKLWVGQDGTFFNSGDPAGGSDEQGTFTGDNNTGIYVNIRDYSSAEVGAVTFNFGQSGFAHTPPTGFTALNSSNSPDPATVDPSAYFQTTLYEGDGSTQSLDQDGNSTFSPNLVWIKNRDATDANALFDTVRGATEVLSSNVTTAEATNDDTLTAFESDGFAIGDDVIVNTNAESYVAWQWTEGTTPGLDIVSYAGTGSARTVAHNLGVVPTMIIIKNRDQDDAWGVYHVSLGNTHRLLLNSDLGPVDDSSFWNDTTPTSSVFTVGGNHAVNANTENYIAYVFAPVEGFSSFGTYTGNHNAYGPMINLGFAPACVIFKSSTQDRWFMKDIKRDPYNVTTKSLHPDENLAEISGTSAAADFNSNGFKIRTNESPVNQAKSYYYAAFAHAPFKTANAR